MKLFYQSAILLFFVLFRSTIDAQSTFLKTYGGPDSGYGTSLVETDDGGFVVTSILPDSIGIKSVLFKTDRNGEQEWTKSYGANAKNVPSRLVKSGDGGFYLLMASWTVFSPGNFHTVVLKLDSLGNEIWNRSLSLTQSDNAIDIDVDGDYVYVVCTSTYNTGGYPGVLVHKLDTAGGRIWSRRFTGTYGFSPVDAVPDGHGRLGILGKTNSYGIGTPINDNNFLLIIDSAGNQLSTTVTGLFYSCEPNSIVWHDGKWIISTLGYTLSSEYDIQIQRFDSTGNFFESKSYDATLSLNHWEVARDIIPQADGSLIMVGDMGSFDERNIMMAMIDPSGNVPWSYQYPVSPMFTNYSFEVVQTKDGGFAFTGDMRPPTYYRDAFILKSDMAGQIPCYTSPVTFVVSPDTIEVSYLLVNEESVDPSVDTLIISSAPPFFTMKLVCENIPPGAAFTTVLDTICPQTCYQFTDASLNTVDTWDWTFNGGVPQSFSGQIPPPVCYPTAGTYNVELRVTNSDGVSTYTSQVIVSTVKCDTLFIPNVITPNGDGKNDVFNISGLSQRFNLQIFNRWGQKLYETQNKHSLWNPKDEKDGVYYYLLRLFTDEGNEIYRGTVSVLKN
ncbi:MAG TPA: gliding motility-associated C-terminal domain-containing protein [Bacteroidia bacterium]|nr:gliding motility-associated C-terminal domain-containing protein [Bacteroidia bacterium]